MRRNTRRHDRLVDMSASPPGPPEHFESRFPFKELEPYNPIFFQLSAYDRAMERFTYWNDRVVWFAVSQQTLISGRWVDVMRIDSCHSEAHIHEFRRDVTAETGRRALSVLSSIEDVEAAFDDACETVFNDWQQERERWSK